MEVRASVRQLHNHRHFSKFDFADCARRHDLLMRVDKGGDEVEWFIDDEDEAGH